LNLNRNIKIKRSYSPIQCHFKEILNICGFRCSGNPRNLKKSSIFYVCEDLLRNEIFLRLGFTAAKTGSFAGPKKSKILKTFSFEAIKRKAFEGF
jgi:hypothetical protein